MIGPRPAFQPADAHPSSAAPLDERAPAKHPIASRSGKATIVATLIPVVVLFALCVGSSHLQVGAVIHSLVHPGERGIAQTIVWQLRMPRIVLALLVGGGLGVAGAALQSLFRNALVDPYITGVSGGAALAAAAGFSLGAPFVLIPAAAFGGGLACAAIVALVAGNEAANGNLRIVLVGVALSALCSAVVTLVLLHGGPNGGLSLLAWLAGGINGRSWADVGWCAAYLGAGVAALLTQVHALNALRLGTVAAAGFGLRVEPARWKILASTATVTAACVAVSGVVGFVGLMVPHAARKLVGGDARWLLTASALCGAVLVVIADTAARTVMAPAEVPLGVLLAFVGIPFFLWLTRRPVAV
ncbi:MAG: hypothetical protein DLM53_08555 [Candidatus Eremiobacter antarcticus]|nr:iron ABC transporter permease [Candidatus Eremiobacteraeota bacterium]MBC5809121.1 iron ABC transporter permease [Candidatus Eremiobacteraeota bacterium]PZR61625.1 MAG: hypothetical protein DLM53_08555 [Candidatus Eremiobacter sp. RRmetagenome_bin22]